MYTTFTRFKIYKIEYRRLSNKTDRKIRLTNAKLMKFEILLKSNKTDLQMKSKKTEFLGVILQFVTKNSVIIKEIHTFTVYINHFVQSKK